MAIEHIHYLQSQTHEKKKVTPENNIGCPWAINHAESNFCFWKYHKEFQDEVVGDKDICNLLGINQATLESSYKNAIAKLKSSQNQPEMKEFIESIQEIVASQEPDHSVYMPSKFREAIESVDKEEKQEDPDVIAARDIGKKKDKSMPLHRDQKKKDIWGIYSKKTLERVREEKKKNGKKDNTTK